MQVRHGRFAQAIRLGALLAAALVGVGAAPAPPNNNRIAEFPKTYPLAFRLFRQIVPDQLLGLPFIGSLDNAPGDGPVRAISMDGRTLMRAFSCMPHDCIDQTLTVLFTPDQKHLVAQAMIINAKGKTSYVIMGEPSARERACLRLASRLDFDGRNTTC